MVDNTVALLTQINNSIQEIARSMAPQNTMSPSVTSNLANGTPTAMSNQKLSTIGSAAGALTSLSSVGPAVDSIGGINPIKMMMFEKNIDKILDAVKKLSKMSMDGENTVNYKVLQEQFKCITLIADAMKKLAEIGIGTITKAKIGINGTIFVMKEVKLLFHIVGHIGVITSAKLKGMTKAISGINDMMKALSLVTVFALPAMIGVLAAIPVMILARLLIRMVAGISTLRLIHATINMWLMTKMFKMMVVSVAAAALLILACAALGAIIMIPEVAKSLFVGFFSVAIVIVFMMGLTLLIRHAASDILKSAASVAIVLGFCFVSMLLIIAAKSLGDFVIENWDTIAAGLASVGALIWGLSKLPNIVKKARINKQSIASMYLVEGIVLGAMFIVKKTVDMVNYVNKNGGWLWLSLGIIAIGGVVTGIVGLAKMASKVRATVKKGAIALFEVEVVVLGVMVIIKKTVDMVNYINKNGGWGQLALGITAVSGVIMGIVGLAKIASKVRATVKKGAIALGAVELVALGAIGVVYAAVKVADSASKTKDGSKGDIAAVTSAGLIVTAFGVLAGIAAPLIEILVIGAAALAVVEVVAAGALGVVLMTIKVHKEKESIDVGWTDLIADITGTGLLIGAFGVIASAFAALLLPMTLATPAMAMTDLLIVAALGTTERVINIHKSLVSDNIKMENLYDDVTKMGEMIKKFGLIASVFSALLLPMTLATPAMAMTDLLIVAALGTTERVINIHKSLVSDNIKMKDLSKDVVDMGEMIKKFGAIASTIALLSAPITLATPAIILIEGFIISTVGLVKRIESAMGSISSIAKMGDMISINGDVISIKPVVKYDDKGNPIFGDPVDLGKIGKCITMSIKAFMDNIDLGVDDLLNIFSASAVLKAFGTLIGPITSFVEMLTGFDADESGRIAIVKVDDNGNVKIGRHVNIVSVATGIVGAISSFFSTLFDENNINEWAAKIYGPVYIEKGGGFLGIFDKRRTGKETLTDIGGILGSLVEPISGFIKLLSNYESDGNTLYTLKTDNEGNVVQDRPIDTVNVANGIVGAISNFVSAIFNDDNVNRWATLIYGEAYITKAGGIRGLFGGTDSHTNGEVAEQIGGVLGKIIQPITGFVKILEALDSDGTNLYTIKTIKEKGVTRTERDRPVDVVKIATSISTAMTTFLETIFANINAETINKEKVDLFSSALTPISSFATTVESYSKTDAKKINDVNNAVGTLMKTITGDSVIKAGTSLDTFKDKVNKTTTELQNFNSVLSDVDNKRSEGLKKLSEDIDGVLTKLSNAKDSISSFSNLIVGLNNMDADKINKSLKNLNLNLNANVGGKATGGSGAAAASHLTVDDIKSAISQVFDSATISTTFSDETNGTKTLDKLIIDVN